VSTQSPPVQWLTVPDLVTRLGMGAGRVRHLIEDRHLLGAHVDGVFRVPEAFLNGTEPVRDLRGTVIVLADAGFSDDEATHWLLTEEETLGTTPIAALREGRKAEVRRVAQALGF
jgi:Rv2175c C-terminal domain of unknown function/DNA-binding protein Rv2175c, wHTH domain